MKNLIIALFIYAAFPLMVILPVEGYAAEETRDPIADIQTSDASLASRIRATS